MFEKNRGNQKALSSRTVFLSCVTYLTPDNTPNVSKIFSREGLKMWLDTRGVEIMHPERSYQRVLYAHIRGADKRLPFPEDVESALLAKIRDSSNKTNPWKEIFSTSRRKLRKRGFKKQGFHEKRRNLENQSQNSFEDVETAELLPNSQFDTIQEATNESTSVKVGKIQREADSLAISTINVAKPTISPALAVTPYDLVMHAFCKYMCYDQRQAMMAAAETRGVPVSSPALVYLLSEQPDRSDPIYDINFLVPPKDQQKFKPVVSRETLIGGLYFDSTWICIGEDPEIQHIMRGSMLGKHALEFAGSLISEYIAKIKELEVFYLGGGVIWRRYPLKRADGSRGVYLFRAEPFNKERTISYLRFQDVSADYPDVISRISFI